MLRLFDTHHIRKCKELEGMWEFAPVAGIGSDQPVTLTSCLFPVAGRCTHASETIGELAYTARSSRCLENQFANRI